MNIQRQILKDIALAFNAGECSIYTDELLARLVKLDSRYGIITSRWLNRFLRAWDVQVILLPHRNGRADLGFHLSSFIRGVVR